MRVSEEYVAAIAGSTGAGDPVDGLSSTYVQFHLICPGRC